MPVTYVSSACRMIRCGMIRSCCHLRLISTEIHPSSSLSQNPESQNASTSIAVSSHPRAQAYTEPLRHSDLPSPPRTTHPKPQPAYSSLNPPFHTHSFFATLEKCFPTPIARDLMRATRAMLMDKVARARREGLGRKDLENQAYLFKAALTELRNDTAMRIRNETAGIHTSMAASRREIDNLSARMKEVIANLRHENQMEVDNRKNEARTDIKKQALLIENVMNKAMIQLGDLRTEMERSKWMNMYRSLVSLASVAAMLVIFMEVTKRLTPEPIPKVAAPSPPAPPSAPRPIEEMRRQDEGTEDSNYVT